MPSLMALLLTAEEATVGTAVETEHTDGVWYAGTVLRTRGEGDATSVLVKWPGFSKKKARWFELAGGKIRHPVPGYSTERERAKKGAGGVVGLIAEAEGEIRS